MALTTRAQAENWRRQQLQTTPPARPAAPAPGLSPGLRLLALRLLGVLALLILGAALWPSGEPTRPLRLADEQPANQMAWHLKP
jgi:hypothetical protein